MVASRVETEIYKQWCAGLSESGWGVLGDLGAKEWVVDRLLSPRRCLPSLWRRLVVHTAVRPRGRVSGVGSVLVVGVYRNVNVSYVRMLLSQCPRDSEVRLWALDGDQGLLEATVGWGPGNRCELIDRLLAWAPVKEGAWVVVVDDDVVFSRGSVSKLIRVSEAAGLDIAQPAHSLASYWCHPVTVSRPWCGVRITKWIECGPLFLVSPRARHRVLPLAAPGMGWVLEHRWSRLERERVVRLGIVDSCHVVHVQPAMGEYSAERELGIVIGEVGTGDVAALKGVRGSLWRWERWGGAPHPPKLRRAR